MPNYYGLRHAKDSARIVAGLKRLRDQLDGPEGIPPRSLDKTLRLATWNLREFDSAAYGARIDDAYYFIAEIMSRFDLVALQEVRRDLGALETLMEHLGWPWRYLVTDTTEGDPGNDERLAFLYDTRKVRFTGLSGELVLPPLKVKKGEPPVPVAQIARTPFTAGFQSGWVKFQLATVHIVYGEDDAEDPARIAEIQALATFLAKRTKDNSASPNLVLLGDFNIFDSSDKTMGALLDAGWSIPTPIRDLPTGSNIPQTKHYDQIAVLPIAHQFQPAGPAGIFNYYKSVFRPEDRAAYVGAMGPAYDKTAKGAVRSESSKAQYYLTYWRTFQMSDHLPMWLDLKIDFSEEYIAGLAPPPAPSNPQDFV